MIARDPSQLFASPAIRVQRRSDASILLEAAQPLGAYPRALSEHLSHWASSVPDRDFLLERESATAWRSISYSEALACVRRIAGGLLGMGASPAHPVAILSDNSIDHGLLMLAAMHIGIPALSISPAYSLVSRDFGKLRSIIQRTSPSVIYVDNLTRYSAALEAIRGLHKAVVFFGGANAVRSADAVPFQHLFRDDSDDAVTRAYACVTPDTIAKILFTSGSTGDPKGVINTQRMLCSNQQAKAQVWPFLTTQPPVLVDWLPWNHTFGGNHNFNLILRNGGTLYIDSGRPLPTLFPRTLANLKDAAPTIYFNVPRGFELLVYALQEDDELRARFFSRLQVIFYGAASLPPNLWDALRELCVRTTGESIPLISGWGATETGPLVTDCHFQADRAGVIGLPIPGCELKLLRNADKWEVRVRGPNVFPGYWDQPELTANSFDEEGFYRIGDAVRFADASAPERGLLFDGRVSEDFKLTTGTWVSVSNLRMRAIAALAPLAQDVVIAGHDQPDISLLIFPNIAMCRRMCPELRCDVEIEDLLAHRNVREHVTHALVALRRESPASSTHAARAVLLAEPPSIDAGEITDKGYINQGAVLTRRRVAVEDVLSSNHSCIIAIPRAGASIEL